MVLLAFPVRGYSCSIIHRIWKFTFRCKFKEVLDHPLLAILKSMSFKLSHDILLFRINMNKENEN